jgi:hypothetical protein
MKPKEIKYIAHPFLEGSELGFIGDNKIPAYEIQKIGKLRRRFTVMFMAEGIGINHGKKKLIDGLYSMSGAKEYAQKHFNKLVEALCD